MKRTIKNWSLLLAICFLMANCAVVKPYEMTFINDEDMEMESSLLEGYEESFQKYREAANGAKGTKTGGGCGCN